MAPGCVFSLLCGMMMLQLVWVKFMMPETKGVPLEQMQKRLGIEQPQALRLRKCICVGPD